MAKLKTVDLTRRESQIMEILYRRRRATVEEIRAELPDPPSPSSVRKLLDIMIERGLLAREYDGPRYRVLPRGQTRAGQPVRAAAAGAHVLRQFAGLGDRGAARHDVDAAVSGRASTPAQPSGPRPRTGR